MRLTTLQMTSIVQKVFDSLKKSNVIIFKEDEKKVFARALKAIQDDYQKELDLEKEVVKMLDDLERQNPGSFQRHKMYQLLKPKLAKEKKVIL
ncbi:MAG: hypothetical protein BroJett040_14170 [Oligoflexia bacterium]|nr:MAG: hypothetical protein BroJett040_14170 [Oligoflexia bacterium]